MAIKQKAKATTGASSPADVNKIEASIAANTAAITAAASPKFSLANEDEDLEIPAFLRRSAAVVAQEAVAAVTAAEQPEEEPNNWSVAEAQAAAGEAPVETKLAPELPPVEGVAVKGRISRKTKEVVVTAEPVKDAPAAAVATAADAPIVVDGVVIGTARQFVQDLKDAYANFGKSNWALGEALLKVAGYSVLPTLGYTNDTDGFRKMLREHIGISYETARARIRVVKYFSDNGLDAATADRIGWSKAIAIVDTPAEKLPQLLAYVENPEHTVEEVNEAARLYKRKDEPGRAPLRIAADPATAAPDEFVRKKFVMTKADADFVEDALATAADRYKADGKEITPSSALRIMATEWAGTSGYKVGLAEEIKAIEAKYGVLLRVVGADEQPHTKQAEDAEWEGAKP